MSWWYENVLTERFYGALFSTVVFWAVALLLLSVSFFVLDKILLRKIHISQELDKGNIAVAIVISAFLLSMGLIIYGVTN